MKNEEQQAASRALGAHHPINYTEQDFVKEVMQATAGRGVDVVVDIIGGDRQSLPDAGETPDTYRLDLALP